MTKKGDNRRDSGAQKNANLNDEWFAALLEGDEIFRAAWDPPSVPPLVPQHTQEHASPSPSTEQSVQDSAGGSPSQPIPDTRGPQPEEHRIDDNRMTIVPGDFFSNQTVIQEQRFRWAPSHHAKVWKNYFQLVESSYRKKLNRIRRDIIRKSIPDFLPDKDYSRLIPFRPINISEQNWKGLCTIWNSEEWQKKSKAGSANQRGKLLEGEVTTRSTLGTKTKSQILKELSVGLDRPCRLDELLQHMCTNPKNGQPYPTRHSRTLEKYCEVLGTKFEEDREKWPVFDKDAWIEASGGVQKGDQWTGVPLEFSNPDAFTPAAMTSQVDSNEVVRLKAELEKKDAAWKAKIETLENKLEKTKKAQREERKRHREVEEEMEELRNKMRSFNASMSNVYRGLIKRGLIQESEVNPFLVASGSKSGSKKKSSHQSKRRKFSFEAFSNDSEDSENSLSSSDEDDLDHGRR